MTVAVAVLRNQVLLVLLCIQAGMPIPAQAQDAAALAARHAALREQLASNAFQRPLYLESSEGDGALQGDIYARLDQPYAAVEPALRDINRWCDILILHLNVKQCRASDSTAGSTLSLNVGRKFDQPLADAYLFEFRFTAAAPRPDYLQVVLSAASGPLGTTRYRILLEVVALDARHSFLHFSYSYTSGLVARLATQLYLATAGRSRLGFSIVGRKANGEPVFIGSTRGVVERNAMRCYLTIEAYLGALSAPAAEQVEQRLSDWYAGVERYPAQLYELERGEYLDMKRKEIQRQQELPVAAAARS